MQIVMAMYLLICFITYAHNDDTLGFFGRKYLSEQHWQMRHIRLHGCLFLYVPKLESSNIWYILKFQFLHRLSDLELDRQIFFSIQPRYIHIYTATIYMFHYISPVPSKPRASHLYFPSVFKV